MKLDYWKERGYVYGVTARCFGYDWNVMFRPYPRTWHAQIWNNIGSRERQIEREGIVFGATLGPVGLSVVWDDADDRFDAGTGHFIG